MGGGGGGGGGERQTDCVEESVGVGVRETDRNMDSLYRQVGLYRHQNTRRIAQVLKKKRVSNMDCTAPHKLMLNKKWNPS